MLTSDPLAEVPEECREGIEGPADTRWDAKIQSPCKNDHMVYIETTVKELACHEKQFHGPR